jgi:hypothetical protein
MRFKVGDRVRVLEGHESSEHEIDRDYIGKIGTVADIYIDKVDLVMDDVSLNTHWTTNLKKNTAEEFFMNEDIELVTIPDSKLARNLYKNNIEKIEDGKIHLKG